VEISLEFVEKNREISIFPHIPKKKALKHRVVGGLFQP
jgi:hypothetical protein